MKNQNIGIALMQVSPVARYIVLFKCMFLMPIIYKPLLSTCAPPSFNCSASFTELLFNYEQEAA